MKQQDLIQLIKDPRAISTSQVQDLSAFTQTFPFFQAAQLLYTLGVKSHQPEHYQKQLRKTAIIASNRAVLYELLQASSKSATVAEPDRQQSQKQTPEQETAKTSEASNTTVTGNEVKVIYVTTTKSPEKPAVQPQTSHELEILKDIENSTSPPVEHTSTFDEAKLNKDIELEISRQLVDAYVQTEVIKTPDLHRETRQEETPEDLALEAEPGSFIDWLQKLKQPGTMPPQKPLEKQEETPPAIQTPAHTKFEEKKKLIDKIIESDPGKIRMNKDKFFNPSQDAKQSLLENEHLITETLAKIYALQGNVSKAVRAYEILSLKFPQKSAYFASLIEKLKTK